jgi:hypothetical protein
VVLYECGKGEEIKIERTKKIKKFKKLLTNSRSCAIINTERQGKVTKTRKEDLIMAKNTMTTREFLESVLAGKPLDFAVNGVTVKEKAEALIAALDKKNAARKNAPKKPSKSFEENAPIREAIAEYLRGRNGESDIVKNIAAAVGFTAPKTTAAIRQMVAVGAVERIDNGRNKPLEYRIVSE